jgi:RNA polymerase sigma-70 factor (ECF subfamily)
LRSIHLNYLRRRVYEPRTLREGEDPSLDEFPDRFDKASAAELKMMSDILAGRVSDDLTDRVNAVLQSMPLYYRTPFVLFVLGERSYEEIGMLLEIPVGTVMSRVHRARSQLRRRLSGEASRE